MSTNGNNHTNGNGRTAWQNTGAEVGGFWGAEIAGAITTVGAMYAMQMVPKVVMDPLSSGLGKLLEPFQEGIIEPGIGAVCKLDECKPDKSKTVAQRAKDTARIVLITAPALVAAWAIKLGSRRWLNKKLGISDSGGHSGWKLTPEEWMLVGADEGMHIAAMVGIQSKPVAPYTDSGILSMKGVLKGLFGMSDDSAHEISTMIALHEVPNLVGALSAAVVIAGRHHRDWPSGWIGRMLGKKSTMPTSFAERIQQEASSSHMALGG